MCVSVYVAQQPKTGPFDDQTLLILKCIAAMAAVIAAAAAAATIRWFNENASFSVY